MINPLTRRMIYAICDEFSLQQRWPRLTKFTTLGKKPVHSLAELTASTSYSLNFEKIRLATEMIRKPKKRAEATAAEPT